ncbi:MAG TPA: polysaccharide deacetylase family protein [Ohtaekwangia sp.]|nr:polysaccharide deacetylase family protein [Ohtaekwangia sp.]
MDIRSFILLIAIALSSCVSNENISGRTEITPWHNGKKAAISITYDDGTINQFRQALPIMDTLGFKGTFYINTADIPGSEFPPKYIGRPLNEIVEESKSQPTNQNNLFERASALRFLNIKNAVELHNEVGALYEQDALTKAFNIVDSAFASAAENKIIREVRPVLLTGEVITWDEIREFAKRGHEFGNHTISHPRLAVLDEANLLYELEKCKEELMKQLGPNETFSAECPFGTEDERVMEYAYRLHPALRNRMPEPYLEELNRWNKNYPGTYRKEYIQWQKGPLKKHGIDEMKSWVDTILTHNNVWLVLTFHGVDGVGWEAKPHEELKALFAYMKEHESGLWVTTFRDATKYMRERMHARINAVRKKDEIMIKLTHDLDKNLYTLPLTLKTYIDTSAGDLSVKQDAQTIPFVKGSDAQGNYLMYQALPNAGDIVIVEM